MDQLFVVGRYNQQAVNDEESEQKKLSDLLRKIEKRKKKRKSRTVDDGPAEERAEQDTDKPSESVDDGPDAQEEAKTDGATGAESANAGAEKKEIGEGFTVLGTDKFIAKLKVKRVLPRWLSNPTVISVNLQDLKTTIDDVDDVNDRLKTTMRSNGLTHMFPVQAEVVPFLRADVSKPRPYWSSDVCVSAPTGSGKTLAFVLPIVQALEETFVRRIRALVVLPVRELALQVFDVFRKYTKGTRLKVVALTGATPFEMEQAKLVKITETSKVRIEADIVVATAGRLVEHLMSTKGLTLEHLRFLVIDEADRVMDNVQNDWLYHLERHLNSDSLISRVPRLTVSSLYSRPRPCQKLLYSATLSQDPEKLHRLNLFHPRLFTSVVDADELGDLAHDEMNEVRGDFVGKYTTPSELTERYVVCEAEIKPLVLYDLIVKNEHSKILVFTNSALTAHRLAVLLSVMCEERFKVAEMSAMSSRSDRLDIVKKFSDTEINVLVSSDALARGIDIPDIDYVVSYEVPKFVKNYIHRVGRTGRAGRPGTAVTILLGREKSRFLKMIDVGDRKKPVEEIDFDDDDLEPFYERFEKALAELKSRTESEERKKLEKSMNEKLINKKRPKKGKKGNARGVKRKKTNA